MRQDRDKFVKIVKKNIQEGRENQFEKCKNCDNQALKYDVGSVMHYSEYAFSKNKTAGLKTIIAKGDKELTGICMKSHSKEGFRRWI